jgi:serine/threonine-protein kinase
MGVVYKARHIALKRVVALKMIRAGKHASGEHLARFRTEAEALARLKHLNIVQIHEVGEHNGRHFLSLEFVEGGSLDAKLKQGALGTRAAARLVEQLARAVQAAHEAGVVHRDLKPANVLLTGNGTPKITDFGLARQLDCDARQTRPGEVLGTPSYMAPEQAAGNTRAVGPAGDIYSLGAILYDLLTGRPPFKGTTVLDTLQLVQSAEPVPPGRLQQTVPRDLETICLKCLQKEPAKRYPSASALAEDLRRFLGGPGPACERAGRWAHGRPALATVAAITLLATLALLALPGLWLDAARRAAQEREREKQVLAEAQADKLREEERLRGQAEDNLSRAQEAVDAMLCRISEAKLPAEPTTERQRRELLEQALTFFQRILEQEASGPALRGQAARARQRVADIRKVVGRQRSVEKS